MWLRKKLLLRGNFGIVEIESLLLITLLDRVTQEAVHFRLTSPGTRGVVLKPPANLFWIGSDGAGS